MIKFNLDAFYNTDLAGIYFDDFKEGADGSSVDLYYGGRSVDYAVIFESEQIANAPYFKKSKLARIKKEDLQELAEMFDFENGTKAQLIADLLTVSNRNYYKVHFKNKNFCDLDCDFTIRGYSQGDYVKIKLVGSDKMQDIYNKDYLTNIFFDCPATIKFEIVDISDSEFLHNADQNILSDFYLCEYLSSVYRYDKEDLITNFEKHYLGRYKPEILKFLNENLPQNLDYK